MNYSQKPVNANLICNDLVLLYTSFCQVLHHKTNMRPFTHALPERELVVQHQNAAVRGFLRSTVRAHIDTANGVEITRTRTSTRPRRWQHAEHCKDLYPCDPQARVA